MPDERSRPLSGAATSTTPIATAESNGSLTFADLQEILGYRNDEFVSVCRQQPGGAFAAAVMSPALAPQFAETLGDGFNIWFGVNPTTGPARDGGGRGTAEQITRWAALYADLDIKPGGCPDLAVAEKIIDELSNRLGQRPSAVVSSGHGLQPYWPIDGGDIGDDFTTGNASSLSRRFGRLVALVAENNGAAVDSVFDTARVLRVPGSVNLKSDPVGVTARADVGGPLTVTEVDERLTEVGIDAQPDDATDREQVSNPAGWRFAVETCNYSATVIDGLSTDGPRPGGGRNPWACSQAVRLYCARRLGCLTENDFQRAEALLEARLASLLASTEPRRSLRKYEMRDVMRLGQKRAAEKTDEQARAELGRHVHTNAEDVFDTDSPDEPEQPDTGPTDTVPPISLTKAHAVFAKWFGPDYDTDALDAMLATVAVERFDDGSDPVWMLIVSGPGAAKTETVQALDGIGAVITSAISSDAALLSATPRKDRAKKATGGLLRRLGDRGVLVPKDVTSILSMNRDLRGRVLAALREVYDGRWCREVGSDGGQTIAWAGRIAVVGAVTTAWDAAHTVVASMGDRFVLVRIDSTTGRQAAGRKAIGNTGDEKTMRAELAAAVAGVIAGMGEPGDIDKATTDVLLAAADLVTLARTAVETDYRGDVIDAHAPEMPTRFAKQLTQIVRGAVAVGMDAPDALRLALRCARDSMPPLRLAIIDDLSENPASTTTDVRKRIDKPRSTVDRQLQALHILGVLKVDEVEYSPDKSRWYYSLADGIDPSALDPKSIPEMSLTTPSPQRREGD